MSPKKVNPSNTDSNESSESSFVAAKSNSTNLNKLIFQAAHKVAENQAKKTVNKAQAPIRVDLGIEKKPDFEDEKKYRENQAFKHDLSVGNISLIESQTIKIVKGLVLLGVFSIVISLIANKNLRESVFKQFSEARKVLDRGEKRDLNIVKAISETYKSSALNTSSNTNVSDTPAETKVLNGKIAQSVNSLSVLENEIAIIINRYEENPENFRSAFFQKFQNSADSKWTLNEIIEVVLHAISIRDWSYKNRFQLFLEKSEMNEPQKLILNALLKIYDVVQIDGPSQNQKIMSELETTINSVTTASSVVGIFVKKFLLLRSVFGFYSNQTVYNFDRNSLLQASHIMHLSKKLIFISDILKPNFGGNLDKFLFVPEYLAILEKDSYLVKFVMFTSMRTKNYQALNLAVTVANNMLQNQTLSNATKDKLNVWVNSAEMFVLNFDFKLDAWNKFIARLQVNSDHVNELEVLVSNYILGNKFKPGLNFGLEVIQEISTNQSKNILSILRRILIQIYQGEMIKAKAMSDSLKPWMSHNYVFNWNQMLGFYAASRSDSQNSALKSADAFLTANGESPFLNLIKYYSLLELRRNAQAEAQLEYMKKNNLDFYNFSIVENLSSPYSLSHLF